MEQFVFLLLIGLIGLINWLINRSTELREARRRAAQTKPSEADPVRTPVQPPPIEPAGDEGMRRLMEALGLPVDEPPALRPRLPQSVERVVMAPPVPRRSVIPASIPQLVIAQGPPSLRPADSLRAILANPRTVRDAVILSEILGRPKAFTV